MRAITMLLILICLASRVGAQGDKSSVEIGTSLGVSILTAGGSTITTVGIPVDAGPLPLFARPAVYATIFASPSVMVEPQLSFAHVSGGSGNDFTILHVGAQVAYLFDSDRRASPYLGPNVGFQHLSAGGSANGVGLGGAVGYRWRLGKGFALRVVGLYRRWLGNFDGINEIGLTLGLGGVI